MDTWLNALFDGVAALGAWRLLVAFGAMFCETSLLLGLLIPGDTVVLIASTANHGVWEAVLLGIAVVAGSLAGESVGWLLGRWFGERLRFSRVGRRLGEPNWLRAERWLTRRGGVAILVSRFLPVLHALVPVTVGMSGFAYRRFFRWTAPACVLWAAIYVTVGTVAGSGYRSLVHQLHFAGWLVLGAIVVFLLVVSVGKRLLHRLERHPSEP